MACNKKVKLSMQNTYYDQITEGIREYDTTCVPHVLNPFKFHISYDNEKKL